jgi:polar amino acid transport system substrate-binding protein
MARSLQEIRDSGTLKVGVAKVIPWVMTDADGVLIGSEIDMATLLASDLGVEEKVTVLMWTQLIPTLQSGDIDVIISGMAITPSRALKVDFTNPYGDSPVSLLARRDSPAAKATEVPAMNQDSRVVAAARHWPKRQSGVVSLSHIASVLSNPDVAYHVGARTGMGFSGCCKQGVKAR